MSFNEPVLSGNVLYRAEAFLSQGAGALDEPREFPLMLDESHDSQPLQQAVPNGHNGMGVVVLSPSLQILHRNRRAAELMKCLLRVERQEAADATLPAAVTQLCHDVLTSLHAQAVAKRWTAV